MTKTNLKVQKCSYIPLKKGLVKIKCEIKDGSVWTCDSELKNWKCEKPSDVELEKLLNEFISIKQ